MSNQSYSGAGRGNRPQQGQQLKLRKNERIRVPKVRVIGADGSQIGILDTPKAIELAKQSGLDLVEVSPTAKPPVCRILNFGKFLYDEGKKSKTSKSTSAKLKELKFRLNIDKHDFETKVRRGEFFLNKGFKLKLTLMIRGREMEHKDLAFDVIARAIKSLDHIGTPDSEAKLVGRNIATILSPVALNKRKLKYNLPNVELEDEEDEDE